jgi:hypothetical protein
MSYSGKAVVVSEISALISVGNSQAVLIMKQIQYAYGSYLCPLNPSAKVSSISQSIRSQRLNGLCETR